MKFYQLQYFVEICRSGSICKAAKAMYVSQPAISAALKEMENEFGLSLFERKNNKLELTPQGEFFLENAERLLSDADALTKEMKLMGTGHLHVKIAAPPMIGTILFPGCYDELQRTFENIDFEIIETGSLKALDLILSQEADIAVAILDSISDASLEYAKLFTTELVFCVKKGHKLAGMPKIQWEDLAEQNIILMREDSFQNKLVKQYFADRRIEPRIQLYSSQLTTIKNFISKSDSGAFLFRQIAEDDDNLEILQFDEPINMNVGIIWHAKNHRSKFVNKPIQVIKNYAMRL